jgi:hypothetical protein
MQYSPRSSLWPDTALSRAFLAALTKWAVVHQNNPDARITLPIGTVSAQELAKVMRALERARSEATTIAHQLRGDGNAKVRSSKAAA